MLNFTVSMGNNCEFGFAQHASAEPINLWRWANIELGVAAQAMNTRFADIANPAHITVDPSPSGRYYPRHAKYPLPAGMSGPRQPYLPNEVLGAKSKGRRWSLRVDGRS